METRALCVVFLACQLVWMGDSSHGSSPYGGNGHVGKKGSERRYQNHYDRSRTSKSRTCSDSFEVKSNYIIRTKESLDNDATFIDAIKVETSDACIKQCCDAHDVADDDGESTITCDATVFVDGDDALENKDSNCFLFQCRFEKGERFRCKFSDHDSYTSSMFGGFGAEPYFEEDEEEQEEEEEKEEEQIPQTKAVPATTQWKTDDKNTNEEKVEEEECNASQFKCDSGECIRLTLLCDDYQDCEDNSDESERCTMIDDGSEPAHLHPTNPPKLQTTNINQQQPKPTTTDLPDPKEDDTIFSELARQLHKEGARQKMQGQRESSELESQRGSQKKPKESDRQEGRHSSEEIDYLPQTKEDDKYSEDDDKEDQWRPRQKGSGRPYGDYDRPRKLRPQDRYDKDKTSDEVDDYRDYPKRPLDDADDNLGTDYRAGSDRFDSRYRGQGRYDDNNHRYQPPHNNQDDKQVSDIDNDRVSSIQDKSDGENSQGRNQQGHTESTNVDKWEGHSDENDASDNEQEVVKSRPKGESTKEDWYGQHQKKPEEDQFENKVAVGGGRVFPSDDDYTKNDYPDYNGNYYDRNPLRGYPNRYPNYRYPYGQADYQDYIDYNHQGNWMSPGRGRGGAGGHGRGNNRKWPQLQNRNNDGDNEGGQRVYDDNNVSEEDMEVPKDKIQGDARDHGNQNSADVPHSRRLRPGLWKIWRYMYGSSAPDYPTEYPPDTDDSENNHVKEGDEEEQQEEEENDVDDIDRGNEDNDLTLTNNIPVKVATTSASWVSDQGNKDTTSKPIEAHQSNAPDQGNKSKTNEDNNLPKVPSSGDHSEVKVVDKQGVTATAVLPLTIGLFLTLFLLLMMSCRLRYMNRRLRYGRLKTNNAHDADYLINGMYL